MLMVRLVNSNMVRPASSVGQLIKGMPSNLYAASTSLFPYASPYDEDGNRIEYPGGDDKVKNVMK